MFIPLSSMSADNDWDRWNEKFMQKILQIVNSERVKYQRTPKRIFVKRVKSQEIFSSTINEVAAESRQYVSTLDTFHTDKVRPFVSDRQMK
jgi:hypothetical protein